MANPLIPQGTLNRLLAAVQLVTLPQLNITSGLLGPEAVSIAPESPASDYLEALTGGVPSPRAFQMYTITAHLQKSQGLAQQWELQRQVTTTLGDVVVFPDSPVLGPYFFVNCVLQNINELAFTGMTNDYPVVIRGSLPINASLFQS